MSKLNKRNPLAKAVKLALLASATMSVLSAPVVFAAEEEEAAEGNKVMITGSRIRRSEAEGASPVTIITREDILRSGVTNIGEFLQRLPEVTGSPLNTSVNNGGNGSVSIDIRGLGRTLTLINGRRTPDGGDFQTIPAVMIERIEILKDGASAIYGSDAMAGVVNIITRKDFEGMQFQAQYQSSDEVKSGAGDLSQISMIMGAASDKGSFAIGIDWSKQDAVLQSDLSWDFMQDSFFGLPNGAFFPSDPNPDGYTLVGFGSSRIPGGNFNLASGAGGCGSVMYEGGNTQAGLPANYRCFNGSFSDPNNDSYNYAPVNFLQTPYERTNIFVEGTYNINNDTSFFTEVRINQRTSEQKLAPMPYDSAFDPSWNEVGGAAISADNFYNPFGEDVTRARRRIVEDNRTFSQDVSQYQYVFGVKGIIADEWNYEVSYNKGSRQSIDIDQGQWVGSRLGNALGPSYYDAGTDSVVCGTQANPINGCVSLNLFGGPGNITQEMLDYVGVDLVDSLRTDLEIINAVIDGEIMDLPAGPWSLAVGYEHRTLGQDFTPDSGKATGAVTGNKSQGVGGSYTNTSYFMETNIPIISDVTGIDKLEVLVGVRYDDFSLGINNTSGQIGVRWAVTDELLLRTTYGESFRAPGTGELYAAAGDSFPALQDPCNNNNGNWDNLSPETQANCVADGVPAGGYTQTDSQLRSRVGGNPGLAAETGESLTVGMAWAPTFFDGFNMTLDYWDITINQVISSLSASTILGNCAQIGASCDKTTRRADGSIDFIESNTTNLGGREAKGVDVNLAYTFDTEIGQFTSSLLYTRLLERTEYEFEGTKNPWQLAGVFDDLTQGGAYPEDKAQLNFDWTQGDWAVNYTLSFIGAVDANWAFFGFASHTPGQPLTNVQTGELILDGNGDAQYPDIQKVASQMYHDLTGSYSFAEGARVTVGLQNLTNEAPPFIDSGFNASTDPGTYRLYGRTWFVRATYDF